MRDRRTYLGSHDIAAILGEHPHQTPYGVWSAKIHGEEPPPGDAWWGQAPPWYGPGPAISEPAWWGQAIERAIVLAYSRSTGEEVANLAGPAQHPDHAMLASSPDGLLRHGGVLECKEVGDWVWRAQWADGAPPWVQLQCQWHLACTGRSWAHIAVRVPGRGLQSPILVERDDELIRAMVKFAIAWWDRHVVGGVAPEVVARDLDVLAWRATQIGPPPIPHAAHPHLRAVVDELARNKSLLNDLRAYCDELQALLVDELVGHEATDAYFTGDDKPSWTYRCGDVTRDHTAELRKAWASHHERTPRTRKPPCELPAGVTPDDLAVAVRVLDAWATTQPEARFHLRKDLR